MDGQNNTAALRRLCLAGLLVPSLLGGFALHAVAQETLKLVNWQVPRAGDAPAQRERALAAIQAANPDVVLLEGVQDWGMCLQFKKALQPETYNIEFCSSFPDPVTGKPADRQVAILCKARPYFYWSEPWKGDAGSRGGFGFIALRHGKHRLAVFSILAEDAKGAAVWPADSACAQLGDQVETLRNWVTNAVESCVLGLVLSPEASESPPKGIPSMLTERGFIGTAVEQAGRPVSLTGPGTVLCDRGALAVQLQGPKTAEGSGVTSWGIELDSGVVERLRTQRDAAADLAEALASPRQALPTKSAPVEPKRESFLAGGIALASAGLVAGATAVLLLSRKRSRRQAPRPALLLPGGKEPAEATSRSYTVVLGAGSTTGSVSEPAQPIVQIETSEAAQTQSAAWRERALAAEARAEQSGRIVREGLIPQVSRWMKTKLLRRLLADRADLLRTQESATAATRDVTERLARIEAQVQRQNEAYQQRILELSQELLVAKSENRELIQARINQLRTEMQAARAKALREAALTRPSARE